MTAHQQWWVFPSQTATLTQTHHIPPCGQGHFGLHYWLSVGDIARAAVDEVRRQLVQRQGGPLFMGVEGIQINNVKNVVHVTTAHSADDVRIFERECRSLAATGMYRVFLAASGTLPPESPVSLIPLTPAPHRRLGRFASGQRKAAALGRLLSVDLWHFHDPELLPVALRLSRAGRTVVWDAHEDYVAQFDEAGGKSWVPAPARRVVRFGTRELLAAVDRSASGVVAATPAIAASYRNPNTVVVGNEARLELFAACSPSVDARQILFTGSVGPGHLFEEVVQAVHMVPGLILAVAGRNLDPVASDRARRVLGDRFSYLGWLDRAGLAAAISASSLGLVTYADLPTNSENAPNKVFEFGAAGLPMVGSPTLSNRRYLDESHAGFLARDFTAAGISAAIAEGLADPQAWDAASKAGRRWAESKGDWQVSESRLLALYERLLHLRSDPTESETL